MKTFILLLALFSVSAQADEWREGDTYREAAFLTLLVVDYGQTLYIAKHPETHNEDTIRWAIGEHPSEKGVTNYFSIIAIAHPIIAYYLPSDWRTAFQYLTIGEKIPAVVGNATIGVKIEF